MSLKNLAFLKLFRMTSTSSGTRVEAPALFLPFPVLNFRFSPFLQKKKTWFFTFFKIGGSQKQRMFPTFVEDVPRVLLSFEKNGQNARDVLKKRSVRHWAYTCPPPAPPLKGCRHLYNGPHALRALSVIPGLHLSPLLHLPLRAVAIRTTVRTL